MSTDDWYQVAAYAECKLSYPFREEVLARYTTATGLEYKSPAHAMQTIPNTNMWNILDSLVNDLMFVETAVMFHKIRGCSKCFTHWDTWQAKQSEYSTILDWYTAYKMSAQPLTA